MNFPLSHFQPQEQSSFTSNTPRTVTSPSPRIERCEFEALLFRAMEILGERAKAASAARS